MKKLIIIMTLFLSGCSICVKRDKAFKAYLKHTQITNQRIMKNEFFKELEERQLKHKNKGE